jgi:hypothetical protein
MGTMGQQDAVKLEPTGLELWAFMLMCETHCKRECCGESAFDPVAERMVPEIFKPGGSDRARAALSQLERQIAHLKELEVSGYEGYVWSPLEPDEKWSVSHCLEWLEPWQSELRQALAEAEDAG